MLAWDGIDLVLALWTPLLVAWSVVGAWVLLASRKAPGVLPPRAPPVDPTATGALQAMLDVADERATAWLGTSTRLPVDRMGLQRHRNVFELSTLVALLMVRDWVARLDREHLGAHAAPVLEGIRSRTGEALLTLLALRPHGELGSQCRQAQRLREQLAELAVELRAFQQALRPAGQDPYR